MHFKLVTTVHISDARHCFNSLHAGDNVISVCNELKAQCDPLSENQPFGAVLQFSVCEKIHGQCVYSQFPVSSPIDSWTIPLQGLTIL